MLNWKNRVDGVSVDCTGTGFEREQQHAGRSTSATRDSVFFWYVLVLRKRSKVAITGRNKYINTCNRGEQRGTHLVASSKIKILGFLKMARAMAMRCF
jgi:hypothetical protein